MLETSIETEKSYQITLAHYCNGKTKSAVKTLFLFEKYTGLTIN
jgi:hypothetical protein